MSETAAPGEAIDDGRGRIFPCEGCGADLTFHIGQQQLKCPFCGFEKALQFAEDAQVAEQDFESAVARMREVHEQDRHDETGQSEIRCAGCSGTVVFQGSLTSSECPYCGSPLQRDKVHDAEHRIPVDGVLPFLVERKTAESNLQNWIRSRWFAPGDFTQRGVNGKFNGVYLPFWTFDAMTFTRYRGERGEHYWVEVDGPNNSKRRERRTRWYPASGAFDRFFDDRLILASNGLPRSLMDGLEPWPLEKLVPFNQQLLAGYFARTYEVELAEGYRLAHEQMESALDADSRQRIGGDEQRLQHRQSQYSAITFKHLLLPVWLLAYRYKDRTYQVAVNAATGEVQGERPWSIPKILAAVGVVAAIIGVIIALQR